MIYMKSFDEASTNMGHTMRIEKVIDQQTIQHASFGTGTWENLRRHVDWEVPNDTGTYSIIKK